MAGYSEAPLAKKLGITAGAVVVLVNRPDGLDLELPPQVTVKTRARGHADVVVAFFRSAAVLEQRMDSLSSVVYPAGGLWIVWPKRSSGVRSDITDQTVRHAALCRGLVDNKVCAVDTTWSALRVVWRSEHRRDP